MRGRKPKPTRLKLLTGNPGRRPLNEREPQLPVPHPVAEPPPAIADDPRACEEWRRLAPMLITSRTVTDADYGALLSLCHQWSIYLQAKERVTTLVVTTKTGHPMPNPYLSVSNKALANCIKLWAELGCTPSSRSRVTAASAKAEADPQDPYAAIL